MPNKTIYVKEADTELWEKAEELAGSSVSALLSEALRRYVEEEDRKEKTGMETIEVELENPFVEVPYRAQFIGRWLVHPYPDETTTSEPNHDAGTYYGVALTQRGNLAVYTGRVGDRFAPVLHTYSSFEEAEEGGVPGDILAMAARRMGADYVHKLDI